MKGGRQIQKTMIKTNDLLERNIRNSYKSKVVADKMIEDLNNNKITVEYVNYKLQKIERFRMLETKKKKKIETLKLSDFEKAFLALPE